MKLNKIAAVLFAAGCLVTSYSQSQNAGKARTIPSANVKTLKGETTNTSTISNDGKPIIISFWATWCKPCIEELNNISEVYPEWQKETGVKLVAISIDDARTSSRVAPFVNGRSWPYEVLLDANSDFKRSMNVNNPPHTFLVNGKGEIVWQHVGYVDGNEEELYEEVKKIAASK
jgi:cytochrome c biogenesis protein CcmG, thiol:disulfide interchange protein DsbE